MNQEAPSEAYDFECPFVDSFRYILYTINKVSVVVC